jgi:hypothetical protein
VQQLTENYLGTGLGAVRNAIQTLAMNAFGSLPGHGIQVEDFSASSSWVDDFTERAGLCLRIPHPERRCEIEESMMHRFKSNFCGAASRYPANRIINFDETSWKCYLGPQKESPEREP